MKKIIAALALFITSTPAFADNCASLGFQMSSTSSMITYEGDSLGSYTAMMNSAMDIGDLSQAKMYMDMAKDSLIRQKGNTTKAKAIIAQVKREAGMCGLSKSEMENTEKSINELDNAVDVGLKTYKKVK